MYLFIFIVLSLSFYFLISWSQRPENIVNIEGFLEKDNWQILQNYQSKDSGFVELKSDKWLMYFIHWRPLTKENKDISIEYTKSLMLNLWGPSMPFEIKGNGGKLTINDHDTYYVDGTLSNGMVHTRFYVWNCIESNRQFIADCNYNLKRKTPKRLFDIQCNESTPSIKCHDLGSIDTSEQDFKYFQSEKLNLSFKVPHSWNTKEFVFPEKIQKNSNIPGMYQNGVTDSLGSVLSLMKDSEKNIIFKWERSKNDISIHKIESELRNLINDSTMEIYDSVEYMQKIENLKILDRAEHKSLIVVSGTYQFVYEQKGNDNRESNPYIFKAYIYKTRGSIYHLFTSMVAYNEIWHIDFDLKPGDEEYDKFINDEIANNILYFKEIIDLENRL